MAKFNNFHELKQQVRLHIIQMNTQTFESYLALDYLLSTNDDIALQFNTKKHQILQHSLTIRQYEMQKQQYFEKLCKNTYNDNNAVFYNYTNSNTFFSIFANDF